jgi:hypothetical protein
MATSALNQGSRWEQHDHQTWVGYLHIVRGNDSNQQPTSKTSFGQAIDFTIGFYQTSKTADRQSG